MNISKNTIVLLVLVFIAIAALLVNKFVLSTAGRSQASPQQIVEKCKQVTVGMTNQQVLNIMGPSESIVPADTGITNIYSSDPGYPVQIVFDKTTKLVKSTSCGM